MRVLFIALLAFLFIGQTAVKAQEAETVRAIAFHISSLDTPFAVQGDFDGDYSILPESIEVNMTKAEIRVIKDSTFKGSRNFAYLQFGLATKTENGKWKIAERSARFSVNKVMNPGDKYAAGTAYFSIPKDKATDLSKSWIVVIIADNLLYPVDEESVEGFAYAHSSHDIFTRKENTVKF